MPVQCHRKNCKYYVEDIFLGNLCIRKADRHGVNLIVIDALGKCISYERKLKQKVKDA